MGYEEKSAGGQLGNVLFPKGGLQAETVLLSQVVIVSLLSCQWGMKSALRMAEQRSGATEYLEDIAELLKSPMKRTKILNKMFFEIVPSVWFLLCEIIYCLSGLDWRFLKEA